MNKAEKDAVIAEVKQMAGKASGMFLADFTGITVAEITELRREFRKSGVDYRVVKNTLARKALEQLTGFDGVIGHLEQPTGIAFGYDDPVAPIKILKKFGEKNERLRVKVGVVERKVYEGKAIDELAKLPSRKELMAGIVGTLQSPAAGIVGVFGSVLRDLVSVIDAIEKKKAA